MTDGFTEATRELIVAASSAVVAIEQGESSIAKLYLDAALSKMRAALDADPEALA